MAILAYSVLARGFFSGKYKHGVKFNEDDTRSKDTNFSLKIDDNFKIVEALKKISVKYKKTLSQVAIAWVLENKDITCALIGMKTVQQVTDNIGAIGWKLDVQDWQYLNDLQF